jgi:hypothetical protein
MDSYVRLRLIAMAHSGLTCVPLLTNTPMTMQLSSESRNLQLEKIASRLLFPL